MRELSVRTVGRLTRPEEFADVVVATRGNIPIRIRDLGTVEDTGADPTSVSNLNGKAAVSVAIRKQSGVNTVALADAIRARMAEIAQTLPPTFEVRLIRDDSEFIRASLAAIEEHLILGGFLAAVIVFIFLRNFRSTLIAAVAIPASIIGAFGVMAALDFTLNQMTMLALTLMVGIVIDDAIVVLENIYRFVEEKGMTPRQAAVEGTQEIGLAVMATTMSLLAVFLPVGFLGGIIGRFMSSFGLTSAAAIAISLIVSFTLTPMLASRWIKHDHDERASDRLAARLLSPHRPRLHADAGVLDGAPLGHRRHLRAGHRLAAAAVPRVGHQLHARRRTSRDSRSRCGCRSGRAWRRRTSLMERIARDMREQLPGVSDTLSFPGGGGGGFGQTNAGSLFVRLKPIDEREFSQQELIAQARQLDPAVPPVGGDLDPGGRRARRAERPRRADSVRPGRTGPAEARSVHRTRAAAALSKNETLVDVDRTYLPGRPELRLNIDRKRAGDLGVRVQDISQTVNALVAGQKVTTFNAASDQYDVRAARAGLVPPDARIDRRRHGAHRHRRAGAAAQPRDAERRRRPGVDRTPEPAAPDLRSAPTRRPGVRRPKARR